MKVFKFIFVALTYLGIGISAAQNQVAWVLAFGLFGLIGLEGIFKGE